MTEKTKKAVAESNGLFLLAFLLIKGLPRYYGRPINFIPDALA